MKKHKITSLISALLILLWIYAALTKLLDYETARSQMRNQVFPLWLGNILAWAVPVTELVVAGLLIHPATRQKGVIASLLLMLGFTFYIVLVKLNYFAFVPCSCGGVISQLSWEEHLLFNLFFLILAGTGVLLETIGTEKQAEIK